MMLSIVGAFAILIMATIGIETRKRVLEDLSP
jgi:hypothetical protein